MPSSGLVQTFSIQDLYGLFIQASPLPLVPQERGGTCWTLNDKIIKIKALSDSDSQQKAYESMHQALKPSPFPLCH